ncbi:CGNR zinc finger domain-containing protein [Streptomyces sp. NPDC005263]|uniref:CGNR zinc finger domain-containing protein n=1 Tax=Streptomyces sp. NPDC005263 TaxID=3364711 RepID=UPI0036C768F0
MRDTVTGSSGRTAAPEPTTTSPSASPDDSSASRAESSATAPEAVVPPAPGAEQYAALDFANSVIALPGGQILDFLDTPATTKQWLMDRGLAPVDVDIQEMCAARSRALREQIRALLASRVDDLPAPVGALAALNDALTKAPAASLLRWDPERGLYRAPSHPTTQIVDHALASLAADTADLLTGPDAERLTACGSPPCNRFLLRHGRRHWCSTRCGDRARAARAYARRTNTGTNTSTN